MCLGGTAGNVIANCLSEDARVSVLLVKARNGTNAGILNAQVPFLVLLLRNTVAIDWNFTTIPHAGLNGCQVPIERGFVLGVLSAQC
ncbi:hypothetical protein BDZ89DRAFT_950032 [Hymenopellis radicata]|nr:hypothetical protein BDZ89DRAFT_950032 [Hymenopellis radicata]